MKTTPEQIAMVDAAIRNRHSIRRFLNTPVPQTMVRELLELAACAPSGTNVQPWKVYALTGQPKDNFCQAVVDKFMSGEGREGREIDYYPKEWVQPWLARRRKVGFDLYGLLGITKENKEGMRNQAARNYLFFDAPVGLIITIDKILGQGMYMDIGLFMGNLLTAAQARGLDTCVQAAFADFPETIRNTLQVPNNELILCGVALGYADPDAPENSLRTERASVEEFTDFRGF